MKIAVAGGGPGGLYFAILTKKAKPEWQIDVYERNKPDDSFGFGVVFSDETLGEFLQRDQESYELIRSRFAYWDDIVVARDGHQVGISGNGFCGCSRKTLLQLLHQRCREEGVGLHFETEVSDLSRFAEADIVVACDGIASQIRKTYQQEFGTEIVLNSNRFVWCGSTRPLDAFTYFFRNTLHGLMVAHSYQYEEGMSTWIFECTAETWEKFGFQLENEADTLARLEEIFAGELEGHKLIGNKSHWRQFPGVRNRKWSHQNIVLLGDAKATAHFSIGSGTKLAMECAIALSDAILANPDSPDRAFEQYEKARRGRVEAIQQAAVVSLSWFENMNRWKHFPFFRFAFGCMTRSARVTWENLLIRDKSFTDKVLEEFMSLSGDRAELPQGPHSAAFTSFRLGKMKLENRIVMTAMGQYRAENGLINEWHFQHYAARALGGPGLIITEMTAVAEDGRITEGCAGLYHPEQVQAWKKLVNFIHENAQSRIGIQLGHAGRKGASPRPWETSFSGQAWPLISASAIPYHPQGPVPAEMTINDMDRVVAEFVRATRFAAEAGFDMLELQAHHGFLLASFLSPLTNHRTDEFGAEVAGRLKFPLRVFTEMRRAFPPEKPMSVRISASDWAENGITEADVLVIARAFSDAGADIINVSTGNTVADQKARTGRMWQVPFSDVIRNTLHIPTITAGNIQDIDQINTIILNGKADLVALGKPLLLDPFFVQRARAYEGLGDPGIPQPYAGAYPVFSQYIQNQRKQTEAMKKALKPKSNKL